MARLQLTNLNNQCLKYGVHINTHLVSVCIGTAAYQVNLKGYSRQRVIAELGKPDESAETFLTYGKSKSFFQDDKVIGISGAEELSKRATLNSNLGPSRRANTRRDDI
jgi:hypothetical protein